MIEKKNRFKKSLVFMLFVVLLILLFINIRNKNILHLDFWKIEKKFINSLNESDSINSLDSLRIYYYNMCDYKERHKIKLVADNKFEELKSESISKESYFQLRSETFKLMFEIDKELRKDDFQANILISVFIIVGLLLQRLSFSYIDKKSK